MSSDHHIGLSVPQSSGWFVGRAPVANVVGRQDDNRQGLEKREEAKTKKSGFSQYPRKERNRDAHKHAAG